VIVRTPRNSECSLLLRTARALLDAPNTRRALAGALLVAALLPGALLAAPSTALAAASAQAAPPAALPAEVTTTSTDPGCAVKSEEPESSWSNRTADTTDKLSDWYTDAAGVLDKQAVSEAVLALEEERKIVMYIVTCDHSPTDGVDAWADSIWNQTFIASRKAIDSPGYVPARNVVLLVIDTEAGEYAWRVADGTSIASYRTSAMEKALVEGQAEGGYSAGVVAAANALRTARNPWVAVPSAPPGPLRRCAFSRSLLMDRIRSGRACCARRTSLSTVRAVVVRRWAWSRSTWASRLRSTACRARPAAPPRPPAPPPPGARGPRPAACARSRRPRRARRPGR